ncbi:MAG: EAL domain-containing protein [Pseudomonadota bacterium]|nr:EAL domain-containing protein [Pseudomonadota bacterium]
MILRRPVRLALCMLPLLIALALAMVSQRSWQHRASALEHENMGLQLQQLARDVAGESQQFIDRSSELADSEYILELLQDNPGPVDRVAMLHLTRQMVDGLLLVSASRSVRLSAKIVDDRLIEVTPDPALIRFIGSATATATLRFAADQWVVARPIRSRGSGAAILGWLVVKRSVSAPLIERLAHSVRGTLEARPASKFDASTLPADLRKILAPRGAAGFDVTIHPAEDDSLGYVALRDAGGAPAWVFRLARTTPLGLSKFTQPARHSDAVAGLKYLVSAFSAAIAVIVGALLACKRYIRRQQAVDARYKAIIDQANDGIVIVDAQSHQVLYSNAAFLNRLGYTAAEASALTLLDIFSDGTAAAESVSARLRDANSQMAINIQQRCKNGSFIDIEVRCNALDVDGRGVLAYVTQDVSLRRKAEQQLIENQHRLDRMAHHDQLTGLPNRHYLSSFLPEAIAEAQATSTMLGVVFLDLDRFKHINDTRGHETGDKLLQEVATRLRACVRDSDVLIRMGGDEFVVIFRNVTSYDEVALGAGRIIESLNSPIIIDQHPLQTTGSVGVSLFPRDGSSMVELLKHSDTAMYQAKDRGRNNVQMFSQIMNRKLKQRVAVEASLREALRLKQLDVHYQPFVNLNTRKVVGFEALMRWRHPVHGMIPADQFIAVAEETGLIVPMGNFLLHRTLQTMSAWRKAGVPLVPISLNIAPAQLLRGELQSTVETLLKTHGIRPEMLQLEMTERAMFDSHAPAIGNRQDTMSRVRDLGVKIAIDDFGTGYSSLSYLKIWQVDALKIDRSFVRDLVTDSSDLAIVSAIIAIARHLNIQVIAEGIEGYQQAEILRRLGCAVGQGFLFARPMSAAQCLEYLQGNAQSEKPDEDDMLAVFSAGHG